MSDQDLTVGQRMVASGTGDSESSFSWFVPILVAYNKYTERFFNHSSGGTAAVLCMTPLEVIKTRLQAQGKETYTQTRFKGTSARIPGFP